MLLNNIYLNADQMNNYNYKGHRVITGYILFINIKKT